jgi:seryl-tRNA synthetase
MVSRLAARDHQVRVTTDHPVRPHTAAMDRSTSTSPVAGARFPRALTYLVYGLAALLLHALIDWFADRIAESGYAR